MSTSKEVKVGAFVVAGLIIICIVVFLIGDEKRAFDGKLKYYTSFSDVQGLKTGAPIRLGGVDIGTVGKVAHGPNAIDSRLYVTLNIVKTEAVRVREDTVARVANKGLLGDKMIELHGGTPDKSQIPDGGQISGEDPTDFSNLVSQVGDMARHATEILNNLEQTSKGFADPQLRDDIHGSVHALHGILEQVSEGRGYLHRVLADPDEAQRLSHLVTTLDRTGSELGNTLGEAHKVMVHVNQGPGFAHDVVYGQQGTDTLVRFGDAAGELALSLRGVREGNGLAHGLLYGGDQDGQKISGNMGAMSDDLRQIVADMRAGKGTIGALLVDPSIYEDMKAVLGNVERSDVLRALVRYSIKRDEKKAPLQIAAPPPPAQR